MGKLIIAFSCRSSYLLKYAEVFVEVGLSEKEIKIEISQKFLEYFLAELKKGLRLSANQYYVAWVSFKVNLIMKKCNLPVFAALFIK